MPRKKRLSVTGAVHHVMSRGIEGRSIFADTEDRKMFLSLFEGLIGKIGFKCYAWVLMDNHYHIVIRTNDLPLAALFKPLNACYARYFGKRHDRHGYLFQDRFKSIATQDQGYIETLIRYVHLNPLRAGVCRSLEDLDNYPWCGHSMLIGKRVFRFQTVDAILNRFGKTIRDARQNYQLFLKEGLEYSQDDDFIKKLRSSNETKECIHDPGCWVIGDKEFVKNAISQDEHYRLRLTQYAKQGWNIDDLRNRIEKTMHLKTGDLMKRGRKNNRAEARKIFMWLCNRKVGIPVAEIARYIGISGPAVSRVLDEGEQLAVEKKINIII